MCIRDREGRRLLEVQKKTGVSVMVGQVVRSFDEYRDVYKRQLYIC